MSDSAVDVAPDAPHEAGAGLGVAGIVFPRGFPIDEVIEDVVRSLTAEGHVVAGVIQSPCTDSDGVRNFRLTSLRGGWEMQILERRGQYASGCRLDPQAISEVAGRLEGELSPDVDLFVVNRFGRSESEGYGLRALLERAVVAGVPILVAVRAEYAEAWSDFHGGVAETLAPDADGVLAWFRSGRTG